MIDSRARARGGCRLARVGLALAAVAAVLLCAGQLCARLTQPSASPKRLKLGSCASKSSLRSFFLLPTWLGCAFASATTALRNFFSFILRGAIGWAYKQ